MAKILIDLNEHTINCAKCGQGIGWMSNAQLEEAIKNGVVIPDNATNGDVIKALYPNATNYGINDGLVHICLDNRTITTFTSSWWNSPYMGYWR